MNLTGIISISGRPGLFKVIAQGKNSIIVESLVDNKRFPAYSSDRISALEDISIYTYEGDKPLREIFADIFKKVEGKLGPSHKEDLSQLQDFLSDILPDYDQERVYPSDIKKLFQWYNLLHKSGNLIPEKEEAPAKEEKEKKEAPKKETVKKAAKKTAVDSKEKETKKAAPKKKASSAEKPEKKEAKPKAETKKKSTTKK